MWRARAGSALICFAAVALTACAMPAQSFSPSAAAPIRTPTPPDRVPSLVDCGSVEEDHDGYDLDGRECVWSAYVAGRAVQWKVTRPTIEGDPIPGALLFVPGRGIVVTQDTTADRFTNEAGRRVHTWVCASMTKQPWFGEPSRYSFRLQGCGDDYSEMYFP